MARVRWPNGAEGNRKRAIEEIDTARRLLDAARGYVKTNPTLLVLMIADASTALSDAKSQLLLARLGESDDEE